MPPCINITNVMRNRVCKYVLGRHSPNMALHSNLDTYTVDLSVDLIFDLINRKIYAITSAFSVDLIFDQINPNALLYREQQATKTGDNTKHIIICSIYCNTEGSRLHTSVHGQLQYNGIQPTCVTRALWL